MYIIILIQCIMYLQVIRFVAIDVILIVIVEYEN